MGNPTPRTKARKWYCLDDFAVRMFERLTLGSQAQLRIEATVWFHNKHQDLNVNDVAESERITQYLAHLFEKDGYLFFRKGEPWTEDELNGNF